MVIYKDIILSCILIPSAFGHQLPKKMISILEIAS